MFLKLDIVILCQQKLAILDQPREATLGPNSMLDHMWPCTALHHAAQQCTTLCLIALHCTTLTYFHIAGRVKNTDWLGNGFHRHNVMGIG